MLRRGDGEQPEERHPGSKPGASSCTPSYGFAPAVALLRIIGDEASMDTNEAIAGLEATRMMQSWLTHRQHRLALRANESAQADHQEWLRYQDDDGAPGLSRAERERVGERSALAQIATALNIGEAAAHSLLDRAEILEGPAAATESALSRGKITSASAAVIANAMGEFTQRAESDPAVQAKWDAAAQAVEQKLLPLALTGQPAGRVRSRAKALRELHHPLSFVDRHQEAAAFRYVRVSPAEDGMSILSACLRTGAALEIDRRLSRLAKVALSESSNNKHAGEGSDSASGSEAESANGSDEGGTGDGRPSRTLTQARADVLADLLGGIAGECPDLAGFDRTNTDEAPQPSATAPSFSEPCDPGPTGPHTTTPDGSSGSSESCWDPTPATVVLHMPLSTALGGDQPGSLIGLGPVAAKEARQIASSALSYGIALSTGPAMQDWPPDDRQDAGWPFAAPPPDGRNSPHFHVVGPVDSNGPTGTEKPNAGRPSHEYIFDGSENVDPPDEPIEPDAATGHSDAAADHAARLDAACAELEAAVGSSLTNGKSYRVPAALRRRLQQRDVTCRFPGCGRAAQKCDVDHVVAWADGGETTAENLAHLCRRHHVLKHHSAWTVEVGADEFEAESPGASASADGALTWTSPVGRWHPTYTDDTTPPF